MRCLPPRARRKKSSEAQCSGCRCLSDPTVRVRLANQGQDIPPRGQQTPAARGFQKAEIEKWWPIIKAANIKSE
jgi:hypothetical protein